MIFEAWGEGKFRASFSNLSKVAIAAIAQRDRWPLWLPVMLGTGAAAYFALRVEPPLWTAWAGLSLAVAAGAAGLRLARLGMLAVLVAALALGFALAKLRTDQVAGPVLSRPMIVHLVARIDALEPSGKGVRMLLSDPRSGGFANVPHRVRVAVLGHTDLKPGEWVSVTASLAPPQGPVAPGAHDFGRAAFFQGIGAAGFAYGTPRRVIAPRAATWEERVSDRIENLRWRMTTRMLAVLPGSNGAIASALITGTRGGIAQEDEQALRDAGLAHALSISGLHMALVGGGMFWLVRALLAALPSIALVYPIKKWAALMALAASAFYLVLTGAAPPATRAFVMLAMMLLAVLCDRPALTMRSLALAAVAVLLVRPEAVIDAGFQMSFAAVAVLVAVAEGEAARRARDRDAQDVRERPGILLRLLRAPWRHARAVALTSLFGSLATAPYALFHFGRTAHYAVLGNLLVMPVIGFWIMPMAALSVVAMPFGLDEGPLHLMGAGISAMLSQGRFVAMIPGAASLAPAMPLAALLAMTLGALWLAIWRGGVRWWGAVPMLLGVMLALFAPRPDMLVASDAQTIAIRGMDGMLHFIATPKDRFAAEQWLRRDGDARALVDATGMPGLSCDGLGCVLRARDVLIVGARRPEALAEDCARARLLVSAIAGRCAGPRVMLDAATAARDGGYAITLPSLKVRSVREWRGKRPWVPD
jgi:competence protein ComEC